jgi:lipase chaperone LimK
MERTVLEARELLTNDALWRIPSVSLPFSSSLSLPSSTSPPSFSVPSSPPVFSGNLLSIQDVRSATPWLKGYFKSSFGEHWQGSKVIYNEDGREEAEVCIDPTYHRVHTRFLQ